MYGNMLQDLLDTHSVSVGDTVRINDGQYEGIVLPRPATGDADVLILKLDDGYNIGIAHEQIEQLEVIASQTLQQTGIAEETEQSSSSESAQLAIISTGGTVASKVDYLTGGVTGKMTPTEMLSLVPELESLGPLSVRAPFTKMSEDMQPEDWIRIAHTVAEELNTGAAGAIVTHGTDFLHFTSAALSFLLRNLHKPVVVTGAQRSADRGSSDARMNVLCSAFAATSDWSGVGVCMHEDISDSRCIVSPGTKVRKMHTSRRDAFRPVNAWPLSYVSLDGTVEHVQTPPSRDDSQTVTVDGALDTKVAIVHAYPGADPAILEYYTSQGYTGIIIEAGALGHVPVNTQPSWLDAIDRAREQGVIIATTSQCLYGRVHDSVYSNLRALYHERDIIPLDDMLPETAYVKLMWVLGHAHDYSTVRDMMLTNYHGELSQRSENTFLY